MKSNSEMSRLIMTINEPVDFQQGSSIIARSNS